MGDAVPADLISRAVAARRARVKATRSASCETCPSQNAAAQRPTDPGVVAVADKAQQRLCRRFRKRAAEHEPAPKIVVAIGAVDREPTPRG
jgi:hypothetical protein